MTHFKCDISGSPFGIHIHGRKGSFECLYMNVHKQKYIFTDNKLLECTLLALTTLFPDF